MMEDRLIGELVKEIAGEDVIALIQLILGKRDVNEFKIAEKMNITVNQVRNMLYRLSAHNLVDFIRKKDKRKGWYIYYWTFDVKKAHDLILTLKRKKLFYLKQRIDKEKQDVYLKCVNDCVRFDTINAMEYDFRCPECGELLVREDADKIVADIFKQINQLKKDISEEEQRVFKEPRKKIVKTKKKVKKKKQATGKKWQAEKKKFKPKKKEAKKKKKIKKKHKKKTRKNKKPKPKKKFVRKKSISKEHFKRKKKKVKKKKVIKKKFVKKFKPKKRFKPKRFLRRLKRKIKRRR